MVLLELSPGAEVGEGLSRAMLIVFMTSRSPRHVNHLCRLSDLSAILDRQSALVESNQSSVGLFGTRFTMLVMPGTKPSWSFVHE